MEILCRLPVRSLRQFKCVSKIWKALISDPYFKMKHLNHAKNDPDFQKFLVARKRNDDDSFNFYSSSSLSSTQIVVDEQKLDCPSIPRSTFTKILSCCDGLVLLTVFDGVSQLLLLWNPSTRESSVIPQPELPLGYCTFGLGYHATSDDYKVLAVNLEAWQRLLTLPVDAEILTLKGGVWRKIGKYPKGIGRVKGDRDCGMDSLAFLHGAFHWVGLSQYHTIVLFDISNEVYGEIPLLEGIYSGRGSSSMAFQYWEECFAFILHIIIMMWGRALLSRG